MARPAALQQMGIRPEGSLQFVIITGLSGAGKSNAMKVFEDLGYFCVDNLPPALLPKFAELCLQSDRIHHVAVAIDVRGGEFFNDFFMALDQLAAFGLPARILFLDASDDVLVRRYEETRRKHPLAQAGGILEGIREERRRLEAVKERADWIVDTSTLTVRELRDAIVQTFLRGVPPGTLAVTVMSFGYKYGLPLDADMVLDVRFLPNPHYDEALRPLPGHSPPVREFVLGAPATQEFLRRLRDLLDYLLPQFVAEGKAHLTIALGCTGGKHRSVVLADELAAHLGGRGYRVAVRHRDVGKE
ncbi:MAG: RNase adapter RapZ [Armatimonadota bacterium]|nr:RNase adapter RapZ [Armatimonadota bacterium]MDR7401852.1 RNase adapter RapZ [Armatimonadota bacterium]MDR7403918.1 RNase adapter RapZ [Armatimonadota bacterium]MDR7437432.1 RNase adapter RapZ [Armatimonadota bacterium]MDR7473183.1 RNase adapter RapZ [Armatimonadota bacterium]